MILFIHGELSTYPKVRSGHGIQQIDHDPVPYTATPEDTAKTGKRVWQELQSGKWSEIAPFTVTPELIAAAKDAKKMEIEAWRPEQEAQPFTFEWNGRTGMLTLTHWPDSIR